MPTNPGDRRSYEREENINVWSVDGVYDPIVAQPSLEKTRSQPANVTCGPLKIKDGSP